MGSDEEGRCRAPEGDFATLVRPGKPDVGYRSKHGRLSCSVAGQAYGWSPCMPPVRLAFADGRTAAFAIVAPGADYGIGGDAYGDLAAHAATLGIPGTLVAVLDATPTLASLADEVDEAVQGWLGPAIRRCVRTGHVLVTDHARPFPRHHARPPCLRAARDWLASCLRGVAWADVPAARRHLVAGAEHWLSRLEEDDAFDKGAWGFERMTEDALRDLYFLAEPYRSENPLGSRIRRLAWLWQSLQDATEYALRCRETR